MSQLTRRDFAKGIGGAGLAASATSLFGGFAFAQGAAKVVVIGGGPGGATVANQLKQGDPNLEVTLLEPKKTYTSCFFSNLYLGGFRTFESITHDYSGLEKLGVRVVPDIATGIDTQKKTVALVRQAELQQGTGEDWNNIELTISTSQPSLNATTPPLASPCACSDTLPAAMPRQARALFPSAADTTKTSGLPINRQERS